MLPPHGVWVIEANDTRERKQNVKLALAECKKECIFSESLC